MCVYPFFSHHFARRERATDHITKNRVQTYLGGRVDGDEDHVGALDLRVDVGREEEVPASALLHHLQQARLVDGEIVSVPCIDLSRRKGYIEGQETEGQRQAGRQTDRTCGPIVRTAEKKPAGDGSRREMKNTFTPGQYNLGAGKMDDCASYTKGYVHVSVRSKVV